MDDYPPFWKIADEKNCGTFVGILLQKCEILGSTHSLIKIDVACKALIMGDIEQF
jgi:hypothetical protein